MHFALSLGLLGPGLRRRSDISGRTPPVCVKYGPHFCAILNNASVDSLGVRSLRLYFAVVLGSGPRKWHGWTKDCWGRSGVGSGLSFRHHHPLSPPRPGPGENVPSAAPSAHGTAADTGPVTASVPLTQDCPHVGHAVPLSSPSWPLVSGTHASNE